MCPHCIKAIKENVPSSSPTNAHSRFELVKEMAAPITVVTANSNLNGIRIIINRGNLVHLWGLNPAHIMLPLLQGLELPMGALKAPSLSNLKP